ncbi:MAG: DUF2878 domain-containing protein [Planctomycetota bacterium]|nr:DUF2878 domain-containing protein [Planctomycetota bacterium]
MARNLGNFLIFQTVWAACVLGAAIGHPCLGAGLGALLLPANLALVPRGARAGEVKLWLAVGVVGVALDSALHSAGLLGFAEAAKPAGALWEHLVPPWIMVLWIAVGSMLRASLNWLHRRLVLAAFLGALGGPLSFWSGLRLGATERPAGVGSVAALSIEYAVVFPILLRVARESVPGNVQAASLRRKAPSGPETPDRSPHRSDAP